MNRCSLLFLASLGVAACGAGLLPRARAQSAPPPVDPAAVLATLKDLKTKQVSVITKEKSGVLTALNAAIADPAKAYEQALAAVNPGNGNNGGGQNPGGNEGNRPGDPRRRGAPQEHTAELLRDRNFVEGLRLHLTYLAFTWQHNMGLKPKEQIGALMGYATQVDNASLSLAPYDLFKKPLGESLFVAYFQMGPYLTKSDDWEQLPFNTDGIYQKTILPELRAEKSPRLLDYWTTHIQAETARASASQNALIVHKFNYVRLPTLLWSRAEDEQFLGQTNQAVADMMTLIKAHPDHPDFDRWINRVTEIVTPPKGEVTAGPGTLIDPATPPGSPANAP